MAIYILLGGIDFPACNFNLHLKYRFGGRFTRTGRPGGVSPDATTAMMPGFSGFVSSRLIIKADRTRGLPEAGILAIAPRPSMAEPAGDVLESLIEAPCTEVKNGCRSRGC